MGIFQVSPKEREYARQKVRKTPIYRQNSPNLSQNISGRVDPRDGLSLRQPQNDSAFWLWVPRGNRLVSTDLTSYRHLCQLRSTLKALGFLRQTWESVSSQRLAHRCIVNWEQKVNFIFSRVSLLDAGVILCSATFRVDGKV